MLHFVVPGSLDQRTGGYLYDARMVAGLREAGLGVEVHELAGRFPDADDEAAASMATTLGALPDGARVVIDGLAMGGLPDIVAIHGTRLRIVSLLHHPLADETGLSPQGRARMFELERAALASVEGVVVTSPFTAGRLAEYGVSPERVRSMEPGTDPAPRARGPGPGEPPVLLCVASVTPRKGHDVLIQALAGLRDRRWRCICAGSLDRDDDFVARVRAGLSSAGLDARVALLGELSGEELGLLYDGASIFVLPSWYEGYGMALTEALARGLPVVSTTGGAIPGTVPAGAGVLVPPGDVGALTGALRLWLDDPAARDRAADAADDAARRLPSWRQQTEAFRTALDRLTVGG